jgi:hypothetical protein
MTDEERLEGLKELLKETARAHHAATGGVNARWALWYAQHMDDRIGDYISPPPVVDAVEQWLITADELYRSEDRDVSWPRFYAGYMLDQPSPG